MKELQDLQRRVAAGDRDAMTELGTSLLLGGSPYDGAVLLNTAAGLGSAEACARIATLAAVGACVPQSWTIAFDFLIRACKLGSQSARDQISALLGRTRLIERMQSGDCSEPDFWRRLRSEIDEMSLLQTPATQVISIEPRIFRIEGLMSEACCEWLIAKGRHRVGSAKVYDPLTGTAQSVSARTNREASFNIVESDVVLLVMRARLSAAIGLPLGGFELSNILCYAPGQRFDPHFDFLDPSVTRFAQDIAIRGQRVATCLVYLNADYEGGETDFPLIGHRCRGAPGDAVLFFNVDAAGQPDRTTLHAGLPPVSGEKWLMSQFIRMPGRIVP